MSTPKIRAKMEMNAEKTTKSNISNPSKPHKPEDKKQSGFASTSVSAKYGKLGSGFSFPAKRRHKKKGYQR